MILAPITPPYVRQAPQWSAQVGAASNAINTRAIGGTVTLTQSTAPRLLVIFYQIEGYNTLTTPTAGRLTRLNFGPVPIGANNAANLVAQTTNDYIFTIPVSTAGTVVNIAPIQTAVTSFGQCSWRAYELSGYNNPVPEIVVDSTQFNNIPLWTANTSSNMAAGGLLRGLATRVGTTTQFTSNRLPLTVSSNVDRQEVPATITVLRAVNSVSDLAYITFIQRSTERGPLTYRTGVQTAGQTANFLYAAWR